MAVGDVIEFNQFKVDLGNKIHDLDNDTFKFGFITAAVTPSAADPAPHFGGTGTTNYATNEVTPGGNYSAGGPSAALLSYADSAGVVSWNANKISIAQHASNPTNARWIIAYNSTDVNKRAVYFVDLGSVRDLTAGLFEFKFNSVDGIGTMLTVS